MCCQGKKVCCQSDEKSPQQSQRKINHCQFQNISNLGLSVSVELQIVGPGVPDGPPPAHRSSLSGLCYSRTVEAAGPYEFNLFVGFKQFAKPQFTQLCNRLKSILKEGTEYRPFSCRLLLHVYFLRNFPTCSVIFNYKITILEVIECLRLDLIPILLD